MGRSSTILLPRHLRLLEEVGQNIRLARLRRKLSAQQIAERADISRSTLQAIEQGSASVSVGNVLQVLVVLGLETDFTTLAATDPLGRKLEDAQLLAPGRRAPRRKKM